MTPQRGALLSIDLGSTAVKVLILDAESGRPLALTRRASGAALGSASGAVEQDPNIWWEAIRSAVGEALKAAGPAIEILGIAADGHGPTLVPVREDGSAASAGSSVAQRSGLPSCSRSQQRVRKRQPDGGLIGDGISPSRISRSAVSCASIFGTAERRAIVYGCCGLVKT